MSAERNLTRRVREWLKAQPDVWSLKTAGGARQRRGVPDVIGCCRGRFFALELKSDTGRPTALQSHEIEKIREAGGLAGIYRTLDDVKALVERLRISV